MTSTNQHQDGTLQAAAIVFIVAAACLGYAWGMFGAGITIARTIEKTTFLRIDYAITAITGVYLFWTGFFLAGGKDNLQVKKNGEA